PPRAAAMHYRMRRVGREKTRYLPELSDASRPRAAHARGDVGRDQGEVSKFRRTVETGLRTAGAATRLARRSARAGVFRIPRAVAAGSADGSESGKRQILHQQGRACDPDEIGYCGEEHRGLQQMHVARGQQLGVTAEPEVGLEKKLRRLEGRTVLVIDPHHARSCVPLSVRDANWADDRLPRMADACPVADSV